MKKALLGVIIIVVIAAAAVLLTPVALAGNVMVPLTTVTFNETTGSLTLGANTSNKTSSITVYEYYFSIRQGGMFRTSETKVNASAGAANINFTMILSTPTGSTQLPMQTLNGVALGNRTHTVYLSIDQGERASGTYRLTVSIDAATKTAGASSFGTATARGFEVVWKVP
jgi:hypothetical protein